MWVRQDRRRGGGKEGRAGKKKRERGKGEEGERRDGGGGRKVKEGKQRWGRWMEGQRSREGRGSRQSHLQGEAEKRDPGPEPRRGKEATLLRAGWVRLCAERSRGGLRAWFSLKLRQRQESSLAGRQSWHLKIYNQMCIAKLELFPSTFHMPGTVSISTS